MEEHKPAPERPGAPSDVESGIQSTLRGQPSRATLPRPHSVHSASSSHHPEDMNGAADIPALGRDNGSEEFIWGPSHPCFPHLNPHVPLSSPLYKSTRIIRIRRDWMIAGDLAPTFANLYPEVLDPALPEDMFRSIIEKINNELTAAFNPFTMRAMVDAFLGAATLWIWDDLGMTGVKARLAKLERWLEDWNRTVGEKDGVSIIPLRRTGYLTLDIQIPDPQLEFATRPTTQATDNTAPVSPDLLQNPLPLLDVQLPLSSNELIVGGN